LKAVVDQLMQRMPGARVTLHHVILQRFAECFHAGRHATSGLYALIEIAEWAHHPKRMNDLALFATTANVE
jgi:hypothetical protein